MYTQMFITSVVVQLLSQQLDTSHLTPMLLHVINVSFHCHSSVFEMSYQCHGYWY